MLAIGGDDDVGNPTGAIHCYDMATNSWNVIGEIPTPRSRVLTAVLPRWWLGELGHHEICVAFNTEIGRRIM